MFRKLLCVAPPPPGMEHHHHHQQQTRTAYEETLDVVERAQEFAQLPSGSNPLPRPVNHYHPRPVATLSEAEQEAERRRRREQEEEEKAKAKAKTSPPELEIDSAYSLHVALGRMLVVASSVAVAEQPQISLVKGHLQLIDEYDTLANRKRKASADYRSRGRKTSS